MAPSNSPEGVDQLYRGPLDQFTPERNELAKRLRAKGNKPAAQEVAKLRKPTVAAWVVNQLAHRQRKSMDRFLAAADDLQQAQQEALSGKGGEHLRLASKAARDAIDELINSARRIGDGAAESTFDRVRETFEAAVADPEARAAVEVGRLERELRPGAVPSAPQPVRRAKKNSKSQREEEIAAAERELRDLTEQLKEAERVEGELQESKDRAEQQLTDARADLRSAREANRKLRRQVDSAKRKLDRTRAK